MVLLEDRRDLYARILKYYDPIMKAGDNQLSSSLDRVIEKLKRMPPRRKVVDPDSPGRSDMRTLRREILHESEYGIRAGEGSAKHLIQNVDRIEDELIAAIDLKYSPKAQNIERFLLDQVGYTLEEAGELCHVSAQALHKSLKRSTDPKTMICLGSI